MSALDAEQPAPTAPSFEIAVFSPQVTAAVRAVVPMAELAGFFARAFTEVLATATGQGVPIAGPAFALYHGRPIDKVDLEAGFVVGGAVRPAGEVVAGSLPAGRAVVTMHIGRYEDMPATYDALLSWMAEQGLNPAPDMWEEYLDGPNSEPDPAKWRTRIVWPIR